VLANDEGYDAYPKNIWAVDDGYDVWGADEQRDSSDSKSTRRLLISLSA